MPAVACAEEGSAFTAGWLCRTAAQLLEWSGCMIPLHVRRMFCMCVAHLSSLWACLSCMQLYVCICVFAALPPYKRGHRKTASFGTILDVPKIVVTGITGPLGFPVTRWSGRGWACGLLSSDMALFCVSLHVISSKDADRLHSFQILLEI